MLLVAPAAFYLDLGVVLDAMRVCQDLALGDGDDESRARGRDPAFFCHGSEKFGSV